MRPLSVDKLNIVISRLHSVMISIYLLFYKKKKEIKETKNIYQGGTECMTMHMCVGVSCINCILSIHQIRYIDTGYMAIHGH